MKILLLLCLVTSVGFAEPSRRKRKDIPVDLNALDRKQETRVEMRPEAPRKRPDGAVDLNALNAPAEPKPTGKSASAGGGYGASYGGGGGPHRGGNSTPVFKVLFDLLMHNRPGISPLTFDNYHNLVLVDYFPAENWRFSFEFNPGNPRYYEVEIKSNERLSFRVGKIAVPFDDMNPHNIYGGFMNTRALIDTGNTNPAAHVAQFLPDIWADLGVGVRYKLVDDANFNIVADLYVTNGFQEGGTDPTGQGVSYPNFSTLPNVDNNTDKAIGFRGHMWWNHFFGIGLSGYECKYTNDGADGKRIFLFGMDAQLRLPTKTNLKAGYMYGRVNLPNSSAQDHYLRGGLYADYEQRIYGGWYFGGRGGLLNGDNRVEDANDILLLGGRFGYMADFWNLAVMWNHDFKGMSAKRNRDYMAMRFVVML